jgi:transcriptional regulator with XRE-family HTH domain
MPFPAKWRDDQDATHELQVLAEAIGRELRAIREAQSRSRPEVAGKVPMSERHLDRIEEGAQVPHLGQLRLIAVALGTDIFEVMIRVRQRLDAAPDGTLPLSAYLMADPFLAWVDAAETISTAAQTLGAGGPVAAGTWERRIYGIKRKGVITMRQAEEFAAATGRSVGDIWPEAQIHPSAARDETPTPRIAAKAPRKRKPASPERVTARAARRIGADPASLASKARRRPA